MENAFCHRLALVIRLVDTTIGCPVTERQVRFTQDGRQQAFFPRGAGTYVCLDRGREDGELTIAVRGYLETTVDIRYGEMTGEYPEVYVELMPEKPKNGYHDFVDITGNMPGITSVAAVCLADPYAKALSYHAEKRQIRLMAAGRLDEKAYALVHEQTESFEEFHVASVKDRLLLRLSHPLATEVKAEEQITRIVRGRTERNGDYLLRLREKGQGIVYLVRYVVKGKTIFGKTAAGFADSQEKGR